MALSDNLDKLTFASRHSIDKIVQQGSITIVNDGDTTVSGGAQTAKIVSDTVTNNYGRAGLIRARWSIDGGNNWQSLDSIIQYSFTITLTDIPITSTPLRALDSAVSIGSSDGTITFITANGKHGNVSRLSTSPVTAGYTPTSRTFLIQYSLYERE